LDVFTFFRHNISLKIIGGESKSVTPEMISSWNETTLPTILSDYKLEDIFNADEFGLFYQCLPDKTYHLKGEKCSGGKKSKVRFTGMATGSATGEKLPMFIIGKSKKPRCFKNVKHLPCEYKSKKKSWMNSEIFEEWVRKIDRKFRADDRKIALIIDNCPAHPAIPNLTNVQLVFLPPNTTSILQPMDQGVIRSLKAHYRGRVVRLLCRALEKKEPCPKISIFKDLEESLNELRQVDSSMVPDNVTATTLVSLDDEVITTAPEISDNDIIEEIRDHQQQGDDEESDDDDPSIEEIIDPVVEKPSRSAIESAIDALKDAAMFSDEGQQMKMLISNFERLYENERIKSLKQRDITDFFKQV